MSGGGRHDRDSMPTAPGEDRAVAAAFDGPHPGLSDGEVSFDHYHHIAIPNSIIQCTLHQQDTPYSAISFPFTVNSPQTAQ